MPGVVGQRNLVRRSGGVTGEVFGRPAELEQFLLHLAASPGLNLEGCLADAPVEQLGDFAVFGGFGQDGWLLANQLELASRVALDGQATVAVHGLGDVCANRCRHRKLGVSIEHAEHKVAVVTCSSCVPKPKLCDAVGVNVLGCALEFCKYCKLVSSLAG